MKFTVVALASCSNGVRRLCGVVETRRSTAGDPE
jgi:hypothetical protein